MQRHLFKRVIEINARLAKKNSFLEKHCRHYRLTRQKQWHNDCCQNIRLKHENIMQFETSWRDVGAKKSFCQPVCSRRSCRLHMTTNPTGREYIIPPTFFVSFAGAISLQQ